MVAQQQPRAAQPPKSGSAAMKGGSAAPHRKGKATTYAPGQVKLMKKVSKSKQEPQKAKKTLITCFKCKKEGHHVRNCSLEKEKKGMNKIQEKKKTTHVKCSSMGHNASMCSNKVDDRATLLNKKTRKTKRKCYGCNEKGHKLGSCPNKKSDGLVSST